MKTINKEVHGIDLLNRYQNILNNGQRAEIRRAIAPDDLSIMPAFYRLLEGGINYPGTRRIVYVLPFVTHQKDGQSLGAAFAKANIKESRLFQVVRSTEPNDLQQLRRLINQCKPQVDFIKLSKKLSFWNERSKQGIIEDYYSQLYNKGKEGKNDKK